MTVKEIAKQYSEGIWDKKDLSSIEKFLDQHVLIHSLLGKFYGHDAMREVVVAWQKAFPDLQVNNNTIIEENDIAVIHWEANGTHLGEFKGIQPSGKKISYSGVTIYRILNEKIIEYWAYLDMHHLMKQLSTK